ncbi:MAG: type II toxin-antitoxin system YoeB family toxin [Desulfohalobiaceae bacterium]
MRHELSGCWHRRINKEHRLVYLKKKCSTIAIFGLSGMFRGVQVGGGRKKAILRLLCGRDCW